MLTLSYLHSYIFFKYINFQYGQFEMRYYVCNQVVSKKKNLKAMIKLRRKIASIRIKLAIFVSILILSCTYSCSIDSDKFIVADIIKTGTSKLYNYKIGSLNEREIQFFEVYMRCSNPNEYTRDSFEFITYHKIIESTYDKVKKIEILAERNYKFNLTINDRQKSILQYPENSKIIRSGFINEKINPCYPDFNEIARIEFNLPNSDYPKSKFVKIVGVRNFSEIDSYELDVDYFFQNKENLFNIYSCEDRCNFEWNINIVPADNKR